MIIFSQLSYPNCMSNDSAVGTHAALRIERAASVSQSGKFTAVAALTSKACPLKDVAYCELCIILGTKNHYLNKQHSPTNLCNGDSVCFL
jgi:hypothetical protein